MVGDAAIDLDAHRALQSAVHQILLSVNVVDGELYGIPSLYINVLYVRSTLVLGHVHPPQLEVSESSADELVLMQSGQRARGALVELLLGGGELSGVRHQEGGGLAFSGK
jgi:hypothetical protein